MSRAGGSVQGEAGPGLAEGVRAGPAAERGAGHPRDRPALGGPSASHRARGRAGECLARPAWPGMASGDCVGTAQRNLCGWLGRLFNLKHGLQLLLGALGVDGNKHPFKGPEVGVRRGSRGESELLASSSLGFSGHTLEEGVCGGRLAAAACWAVCISSSCCSQGGKGLEGAAAAGGPVRCRDSEGALRL